MTSLPMYALGVPPGLRAGQLSEADTDRLTALVVAMESAFFGTSQTTRAETLGTLRAPGLHGLRGTLALWDGSALTAALLVHDEAEHGRGVYLEMYVDPAAGSRSAIAVTLLRAAQRYARALPTPADTYLKTEHFEGDAEVAEVLAYEGYTRHRTYLRMRLEFTGTPPAPVLPHGLRMRPMTEDLWPDLHTTIDAAFADHYDYHPLPLAVFREEVERPYSDLARWRLVYDGPQCVGACLSGNRYAPTLGYVDSLGVVPSHRRRGIAAFLLRNAFHEDAVAGFSGTSLHCDATNPTGANQLYTAVGMRPDMTYRAWRRPLGAD